MDANADAIVRHRPPPRDSRRNLHGACSARRLAGLPASVGAAILCIVLAGTCRVQMNCVEDAHEVDANAPLCEEWSTLLADDLRQRFVAWYGEIRSWDTNGPVSVDQWRAPTGYNEQCQSAVPRPSPAEMRCNGH